MPILRTPEVRFQNLPGYDFEPNYVDIDGLRMHYVDEGRGETILCLHGEPTWSFLYRKFFPVLSPHYRVIAPDFIGFGKSDKYSDLEDYSFQLHFNSLKQFIEKLDLQDITLVVQDWGGLVGLSVLAEMEERFKRIVILNTFLPTGDRPMPMAFKVWRGFAKHVPGLPIGLILRIGCYRQKQLNSKILKAYRAPFPSNQYKAGAKAWPLLVPMKPTDEGVPELRKAREVLSNWQKPTLVMFSDKDPIMAGGDRFFRKLIPTANEQPKITIRNAGHFLQEDAGKEIAERLKGFMERTRG